MNPGNRNKDKWKKLQKKEFCPVDRKSNKSFLLSIGSELPDTRGIQAQTLLQENTFARIQTSDESIGLEDLYYSFLGQGL